MVAGRQGKTSTPDTGLRQRVATGAALLFGLVMFGTAGYVLIEGWSFLDALYMTVTTVATVGFREVNPLSTGGRIFTLFLIVFGVGVFFYAFAALVQIAVEGEVGRMLGVTRMKAKIGGLREHYILCGFGRVGEEIARELRARGTPFVVVDANPEALGRARRHSHLLVEGDATSDVTLEDAGIAHAACLLAASDSDSGNTYITLTAKALNPDVFVIARVGQPENESKMRRAGADRVISPYMLAGRRMVLSALQPLMVDFVDTLSRGRHGEQILVELEVAEDSCLAAVPVREVRDLCPSATILGIQKEDGRLIVTPPPDQVLAVGDQLMVFGEEEELERLNRRLPTTEEARVKVEAPVARPGGMTP
jgi:voltage-gated potassium channel